MTCQGAPNDWDACRLKCLSLCLRIHRENTQLFISIAIYLTKTPPRIKQKPGERPLVLKLQTAGGLPRCRGWERRTPTRAGAKTLSLLPWKHLQRPCWKNPRDDRDYMLVCKSLQIFVKNKRNWEKRTADESPLPRYDTVIQPNVHRWKNQVAHIQLSLKTGSFVPPAVCTKTTK